MTESTKPISPLRRRMIEDMTMRKLSPKTQTAYIRAVKKLTRFLGRSPDTASAEDLRRFQLRLVADGVSRITLNATITGLKFFFDVTLERGDVMRKMSPVYEPRKLPVVLSAEEVTRLLDAAPNLKGTEGDSRRARQRPQRPLRHALDDAACTVACLVVRCPGQRQDAARRLVVPRSEPGQPDVDPSTQPALSRDGPDSTNAYPCTL